MILETMRFFEDAGTYSSNEGSVAVKLQQEAGGSGGGSSYTSTEVADAEVVMSIDYLDEELAWGEVSVGTLWNRTQELSVTVTPTTIPVWCNDLAI